MHAINVIRCMRIFTNTLGSYHWILIRWGVGWEGVWPNLSLHLVYHFQGKLDFPVVVNRTYLRELDTVATYSVISCKDARFCDFLFNFLHSNPLLKRGLH